jgi:hypothetical protein
LSEYRSFSTTDVAVDLAVVGGGIAGCAAAIAASRLGLRVALVQDRPVLGGNASSEIGLLMGGADRDFKHARETGIVEEIDLVNRYHNHEVQWRNSVSDATLENLVKESGVVIHLNTHAYSVEMETDRSIRAVLAVQQSTEKGYRFISDLFVDATGDGSIAALSGAEFRTGSEARREFGESLAPEEPSNVTMGSTLMFRLKDMGRPVPFVRPHWAYHYPKPEDLPRRIKSLDKHQLWIEYGARRNTISDNMEIREELLKILYGVWDHMKNHGSYGAENYALSWVGSVPGKRESRRVVGDYVLSQKDVTDPTEYRDAVAYGGWPIDVHNPDGFYSKSKFLDYTHLEKPYPIPYRCYYSKNIDNLFMAGRVISATHVAHGSIRLIRTCGVGGQAVGTAAYLCRKYGKLPREVGEKHVKELQQLLLKYDCHIPGLRNEDPGDMARRARVTSPSEYEDPASGTVHSAEKVIEGVSRGREGDENLWMSNPVSEFYPAYVQLEWEEPITCNTIHLTFDTMVREQRFFDKLKLGPLPTCVKDYAITYLDADSEWRPLCSRSNNFLRHNIIRFSPVTTGSIRVEVEATNGDELARTYEIRVYNEQEGTLPNC